MNVLKRSLRKNMTNESTSFTRGLRWGRLSRAHIKMLIWFWWEIIYKIPGLWLKGTQIEVEVNFHQQTLAQHSQVKAWPYLEWIQKQAKLNLNFLQVETLTQNQRLEIVRACQEVVQESSAKMVESSTLLSVNSITSFTWIAHRRQSRWWESSTSQHQSWKCPVTTNNNSNWSISNQVNKFRVPCYLMLFSLRAKVIFKCMTQAIEMDSWLLTGRG